MIALMATTVLRGGRVIDPRAGTEQVADVLIGGKRVAAVGQSIRGDRVVDVSGLIVGPGFIDLHSHVHSIAGQRLQALDGVTTSLELEAGLMPVAEAYRRAGEQGRQERGGRADDDLLVSRALAGAAGMQQARARHNRSGGHPLALRIGIGGGEAASSHSVRSLGPRPERPRSSATMIRLNDGSLSRTISTSDSKRRTGPVTLSSTTPTSA
jgi:hypothetical protein